MCRDAYLVLEVFLDYFLHVIENEPFRLAALSFSRGGKFQENLLGSEQEMLSSHKT